MNSASVVASSGPFDSNLNAEQLLANVEQICDVIAVHCDAEEAAGRLTGETVDALYDAGVLAMKLPACLGGGEADLVTQFKVLERLARANPSAAWCSMVGATSLGMPGAFLPDDGIDTMFAGDRLPRGAIVISPTGVATPVDDGFCLTGRWAFASGIHHAQWIAACSRVDRGDDGSPEIIMAVFPAAEARLHDNWHVAGLKGTGSCDFSIENLHIPGHMAWDVTDAPRRGGPLYRLGIPAFVANEHAAFPLGVARCALDRLVEIALSKARGYGPAASKLASRETLQHFVGRAEMSLNAARTWAIELNERALEEVDVHGAVSPRLNAELRSVATYCTEVAADITTQAFRYAGAAAVYQKNAMQRCLRDVNVAAQHLMVNDTSYQNLGKIVLGFEDVDPMA